MLWLWGLASDFEADVWQGRVVLASPMRAGVEQGGAAFLASFAAAAFDALGRVAVARWWCAPVFASRCLVFAGVVLSGARGALGQRIGECGTQGAAGVDRRGARAFVARQVVVSAAVGPVEKGQNHHRETRVFFLSA